MGDPAGVGPEVIAKAFLEDEWSGVCRAVVIGAAGFMQSVCRQSAPAVSVRSIASPREARCQPGVIDLIDLDNVSETLDWGRPSARGGQASVEYIRAAVNLALKKEVDALTTAPINKQSIHLAGYPYPGHTEMLAEFTHTSDVALMLAGRKLRVVLVTTHVPLKGIASRITADGVAKTVRLTHRWLSRHVCEHPRIAVTGLNPHCGEGGIFGEEEITAILPALETVRNEGLHADGPFSADSLFARNAFDRYDAIVTMYHDQGMIPVKMESMGAAVNITLGLPIIRTSVDHGTAYDIAGTGTASPESLKSAIRAAVSLSKSIFAAP